MRTRLLALAALVLAPPLQTYAQPQPAISWSAIDSLRNRLRTDVATDSVGSITAAVVVGDRVVWAEGFGFADRDRKIPAGVETLYRIGSISKSFTAASTSSS